MTTLLKHTLNPSFALLFAVGVDRFYKILDPVLEQNHRTGLLCPTFYIPLTMVVSTLVFAWLSSIANDQYMEAREHATAISWVAVFSYCSIICALYMLYVAVDLAYVPYWWLGYAALCLVNAVWNGLAVKFPYSVPYVAVNLAVGLILVVLVLKHFFVLAAPLPFYVLLLLVCIAKGWQRRQKREFPAPQASTAQRGNPSRYPGVLIIAHAGTVNPCHANTLEGIREVIARSVQAIEVDVQFTKDQTPVLFHDSYLPGRGTRKRVRDLSYVELAQAHSSIPPLTEVLKESHTAGIQVLLDIKDRDAIDDVMRVIRETVAADKPYIACFDYWPLVRAKEICPDISTVLTLGFSRDMFSLRGFPWSVFALVSPRLATRLTDAAVILCPAWRLTSRLVKQAHGIGLSVFAWDAKGPEANAHLKNKCIDALVTDLTA